MSSRTRELAFLACVAGLIFIGLSTVWISNTEWDRANAACAKFSERGFAVSNQNPYHCAVRIPGSSDPAAYYVVILSRR
jgi:hypothetical protein